MKKILFIFLVLFCFNANSTENVINTLKIVKKVYFKSETSFDNCGIIHGKINFFSNGKSEEIYTCQETKSTHVWNGDWKDISKIYGFDRPKLSWIEIAYSEERKRSFLFQKDFIKSTDREKSIEKGESIYVYTDEKFNKKEKSKVVKKKNENSKDLSGNAIDCYAKNTYERRTKSATYPNGYKVNTHYYATIKFFTKTKVKLAIAIVSDEKTERTTDTVLSEKEFKFLLPEGTFNYEVEEEVIVIKVTKNTKNLYDPFKYWKRLIDKRGEEIIIRRKTLDIFDPVITGRAVQAGNRMKCKLVDYDDASLFKKYNELNKILNKLLQKQKKESESKNIL